MILGSVNASSEIKPLALLSSVNKVDLKFVVCNTSEQLNYVWIYINNTKQDITAPVYFKFPVQAFDTFVSNFTFELGSDETLSVKAAQAGIIVSVLK